MNAAETIQAAIERLEELKWERGVENGWLYEVDPHVQWPDDPRVPLVQGGPDVMLMRTVDAQLAILQDAAARLRVELNVAGIAVHYRFQLALAQSILGDDS